MTSFTHCWRNCVSAWFLCVAWTFIFHRDWVRWVQVDGFINFLIFHRAVRLFDVPLNQRPTPNVSAENKTCNMKLIQLLFVLHFYDDAQYHHIQHIELLVLFFQTYVYSRPICLCTAWSHCTSVLFVPSSSRPLFIKWTVWMLSTGAWWVMHPLESDVPWSFWSPPAFGSARSTRAPPS